jgi:bifunctional UDP-N-acetylglucosamine pyrophosphorylase/glucosamine-1-phosphate N-acetyltransferase
LGNLKNNNSKNEYYLTDVVNMAVEEGKTIIGIKSDTWIEVMGINTRKELADAERSLQEKMIGELMARGVGFADPARVDIRGNLVCGKDVFIDVNTIFEGDVELGNNVTIESNNVIVDTKVGNKTVVGKPKE